LTFFLGAASLPVSDGLSNALCDVVLHLSPLVVRYVQISPLHNVRPRSLCRPISFKGQSPEPCPLPSGMLPLNHDLSFPATIRAEKWANRSLCLGHLSSSRYIRNWETNKSTLGEILLQPVYLSRGFYGGNCPTTHVHVH